MNSSSSSEGSSAQCRSSRTTTSGRDAEALARKVAIASKNRKRDCSSSPSSEVASPTLSATSGTTRAISAAPRAHLPGERDRVGLAGVGADRLHPGPVGRRALALQAAPPVDVRPAHPGEGRNLLRRPRLADPRLARQQDQLGAAPESLVGRRAELGELLLATDEDAAGEALERVLGRAGRIGGRGAARRGSARGAPARPPPTRVDPWATWPAARRSAGRARVAPPGCGERARPARR